MRQTTRVAILVVLWLLAWGELTVANVLSGIAVAAVVLLAFPPRRSENRVHARVRLRPVAALRLGAYVMSQLVVSNILMTRQILSRRPDVRPGVLAHRLRAPSDEVVTVMTSIISLSPGTMTADVDERSSTIFVHFFRLRDVDGARASLDHLEQLVTNALGFSKDDPVPAVEESP